MSLPDSSQRTRETEVMHLREADRETVREEMERSKVQEKEGGRLKSHVPQERLIKTDIMRNMVTPILESSELLSLCKG